MYEANGEAPAKVFDFRLGPEGETDDERKERMKNTPLAVIPAPGLKEIKQIELFKKWRPYVPRKYQDEICPVVSDEMIEREKKRKRERANQKKGSNTKSSSGKRKLSSSDAAPDRVGKKQSN